MTTGSDRMSARWLLAWILALGVVIRAVVITVTGGHTWDLVIMTEWGEVLRDQGTSHFYEHAKTGDHLPGDLWIHFWAYQVWNAIVPDAELFGGGYYKFLRLIPATFDILLGLGLYLVVKPLAGDRRALIATAMLVLNPATIFISSMWGQWDVVSMALLMAALAIVIRRPERWLLWAVPLVAWSVTIKPPLALPGALILLLPLVLAARDAGTIKDAASRVVGSAAKAVLVGLATIVVVCLPFNVGLPGLHTDWTLFERANIALDLYPFKVLAAGNIWMLQVGTFDHEAPGMDDRVPGFLGLDAHALGNVYLATAVIAIGAIFLYLIWTELRRRPYVALSWACAAVTFATYMLPTRVHERYLFPAFIFVILTIALTRVDRLTITYLAVFSATFVANLAFVYWGFNKGFAEEYGQTLFANMLRATSVINIALFALCLALVWMWIGRNVRQRLQRQGQTHRNTIVGARGD